MRYLVVLLLTGCAVAPQQSATIVWHRTNDAVGECMKFAQERTVKLPRTAFYKPVYGKDLERLGYGCSVNVSGVCHVFAKDEPVKDGRFEKDQWAVLGHEVKHCFDGNFHK